MGIILNSYLAKGIVDCERDFINKGGLSEFSSSDRDTTQLTLKEVDMTANKTAIKDISTDMKLTNIGSNLDNTEITSIKVDNFVETFENSGLELRIPGNYEEMEEMKKSFN